MQTDFSIRRIELLMFHPCLFFQLIRMNNQDFKNLGILEINSKQTTQLIFKIVLNPI